MTSDFSASPFFSHIPGQHLEYPFVDYRPGEISTSVFDSNSTATGLPLIAPVAQLGCSNGNNLGIDHMSSSVTPYATASLINAEVQQKASTMSPGSRTPSDGSSNGGSSHLAMVTMHSPQRYSVRPQQYISRSSSGTTTGAEEDYLAHHHHQQQTFGARRKTIPTNMAPCPQVSNTFAEYDMCIPSLPAPPPPIPQHQFSNQVSTNGGIHTPVF